MNNCANYDSAIKQITNLCNLKDEDVLKVIYDEIEQAISTFREEIRLASSVETLQFIRRHMWDKLLSERGIYYSYCKKSPMLKILRLNADIRYCSLLENKRRKEEQQITYTIKDKDKPLITITHTSINREDNLVVNNTVDNLVGNNNDIDIGGELTESVIIYSNK